MRRKERGRREREEREKKERNGKERKGSAPFWRCGREVYFVARIS